MERETTRADAYSGRWNAKIKFVLDMQAPSEEMRRSKAQL